MRLRWLIPLLILPLSACMVPPPQLAKGPFQNIPVAQAQQQELRGGRVRWGGTIASVDVGKTDTCFEIVSHPLDKEARPVASDETGGRFIACAPGFYDPSVYAEGREVTVTGTLESPVTRKIGERDYLFPRVKASVVYLWPRRPPYRSYSYPYYYPYYGYRPFYDPFMDPFWYPYWGPWPYGY
jgi:outer membrane lipoprotein